MRGRKPYPIQRQIVEGDRSKLGVHKLDARLAAIPKAEPGLGDCPADLGEIARAAWKFWRAELERMKLAFRPDRMALEGACTHYERARQADALIRKHGLVIADIITDEKGKIVARRHARRNPAIAISHQAWALVRSFCSEFGLSPTGRQRLAVEPEDTSQQELLALLMRPRTPKTEVL